MSLLRDSLGPVVYSAQLCDSSFDKRFFFSLVMEIRQRALWHNILYISALAKLISATMVLHLHIIPSFNIHIVFSWVILLNRPQVLTKSYILAP